MSYRTTNCFYIPSSKRELIEAIVKFGKWNGTKTALTQMSPKQCKAIFIRLRQEAYQSFMKKDVLC